MGVIAETLAGWMAQAWYEHVFDHDSHTFGPAGRYRLATEDEYRQLGEDPRALDLPLILVSAFDGSFFEVDLDVTVHETSPDARRLERERLAKLRESASARAARRGGQEQP